MTEVNQRLYVPSQGLYVKEKIKNRNWLKQIVLMGWICLSGRAV